MCRRRQRERQLLLEQQRQERLQVRQQPRPTPRPAAGRDTTIASSAINSALRFPPPKPQQHENINAEVLDRAGVPPPSYDSVMTQGKHIVTPSKPKAKDAAELDGSQLRVMNAYAPGPSSAHAVDAIPDNVTVFSEDPVMFTPPGTRAPTVIYDHDHDHERAQDSDVDSVVEEVRAWERRQSRQPRGNDGSSNTESSLSSLSSAGSSRWQQREAAKALRQELRQHEKELRRHEKDERRAERAAKKAEKWVARAVRSGYVFESDWAGVKAVAA